MPLCILAFQRKCRNANARAKKKETNTEFDCVKAESCSYYPSVVLLWILQAYIMQMLNLSLVIFAKFPTSLLFLCISMRYTFHANRHGGLFNAQTCTSPDSQSVNDSTVLLFACLPNTSSLLLLRIPPPSQGTPDQERQTLIQVKSPQKLTLFWELNITPI